MNTLNGYSKSTLTDNFVLTAAGGHLAVGNAENNIPLNNGTVCTNLNADLLDDKHASSFILISKTTKSTVDKTNNNPILFNVENEELISGYHKYWYVFNMGSYSGGNFRTQIAMPYLDSLTDTELFIRSANKTAWRDWRQVLHSGNSYIKEGTITLNGNSITPLTSVSWDDILSKPTLIERTHLFSKSDYLHYVVLLCNKGVSNYTRVTGKLYTLTSGAGRYQAADIDFWYSNWSNGLDGTYYLDTYGLGTHWKLVTLTYNGATWFALLHTNIQSIVAYFEGSKLRADFTSIHYYTSNKSTIVNSEIYNSILEVDYSLKTLRANITGNANSATKLKTARAIWGQSFDGSGDITGDLAVGNGDIYLNNGRNIRTYPTSGGSLESVCLTTGNNLMLGRGIAQAGYDTYLNGNNLVFRYGTAPTEGMRLTSSGSVLIGTTADSGYKLDVNGDVKANIGHFGYVSPAKFNDGIRLYGTTKSNSWSSINFGCDPSVTTGSHADLWMIGRNTDNNFMIGCGSNYSNNQIVISKAGAMTTKNSITATKFIKSGGTASQFLKADGSVDSNNYLTSRGYIGTTAVLASNVLLALTGVSSIFVDSGDATLKIYSGRITDAQSDGNICLLTSIDSTDGQSHAHPTNHGARCNLVLQPRGGLVYIGTNPDGGNTNYKLSVNGTAMFQSNSSTTGVSLVLKNQGWTGSMSTAMDFYNGRSYAVPNARISTLMNGDGKAGGTLIFYTLGKHASTNPNPNGLTERMRIGDDGSVRILSTVMITKDTDAAHNTNNWPALIVGGSDAGAHIEIDNNEILAKTNSTSIATLYLNAGGEANSVRITEKTVGSTTTPVYLSSGAITQGTSYAKAITAITRSDTTFTYTCIDGTTGTFTLQDNNSWRGITDSYSGTDSTISLSQKGAKSLFDSVVKAYATRGPSDSIDSDWGQSMVSFDPICQGTYPSGLSDTGKANVTLLNLGNNYNRRKQFLFNWYSNDIYYRRRNDATWTSWSKLAMSSEVGPYDFDFTDGTTVADWTKATSETRSAGKWFSVSDWGWAHSRNINVGGSLLDRMRYSALSIRSGNLNSTWQLQAILFIPTYEDSGVMYLALMTTAATAGSVTTKVKYYGDVGYNDGRYVNSSGDTMTGTLIMSGISTSNWTEGIRINNATNGWSTLTMGGTATSGTGDKIWSLHAYDGTFYINHNGSSNLQSARAMATSTGWTFGNTSTNSYALNTASFICDSWIRTKGTTGWYNEDYGGGWHMSDSVWIRNYNNKPMYYNINNHNTYGTGGHRLAACFYGSSHVSLLLLNSSNGWGLNSNSDGNFYFGFRNQSHVTDTTKDSYPSYLTKAGYWYATHYYESSDVNLKTNIEIINSSDNIPLLKSFDWKESGEHSYGLIAQELEEQGYSELVSTKDDGYKTVNYSAALSLIVGKLQVKIRELEEEIENLKNKN